MNFPHHDKTATTPTVSVPSPCTGAKSHNALPEDAPSGTTRRSIVKGALWVAPAITVVAPAPAYAASLSTPLGIQFDGGGGANGYLQDSYLNLGLAPFATKDSDTLTEYLVVTFDVVGLSGPASNERSMTVSSSYGTLDRKPYNSATRTTSFTWTLPPGTVFPKVGLSTSVPDVLFLWRDGATGIGRITNKIVVTGVKNGYIQQPSAPPIDSSKIGDVRPSISPDGIY